ncbi:G-protein alpha subunit-domain-containing protein [Pisolithus marmoratus]|nr:G-protein alpha subunit-domain-containing protein [Pisolithus marmoratus]
MGTRRHKVAEDDPLTRAMAPPPNETQQQREARIRAEQEAKRVSDTIDEELSRQRVADRKGPKPIKILLLGQSESGKSTTLKSKPDDICLFSELIYLDSDVSDLQLMHSPKTFRAEKAYWRSIIQLNVVQSILAILDIISRAHAVSNPFTSHAHGSSSQSSSGHVSHGSSSSSFPPSGHKDYPPLTAEHLKLKMRLAPLGQVEAALIKKILPPGQTSPAEDSSLHEVCINSNSGWKSALSRIVGNGDNRKSCDTADMINWTDPDDPGVVMHACAEDMKRLWSDPIIKRLMEVEKMRPEDMAGFFLDDLDRVTSLRYVPSDDDVLRARIKTVGVSEHRFSVRTGPLGSAMSHDWRVFDVGGQRSLIAAWVPYFDDINAIIFLAPISCFDQVLQEDSSVNRLADSFLLWKTIVSHPLLKKAYLILFLNKCDILRVKLESGIRLGNYITSYGNRPNDFESASIYLKKKFVTLMREHTSDRSFYCHFTSVTDMKSTSLILQNVQDVIVHDNLKRSALVG